MSDQWVTKRVSVKSLHLDAKNPRLGRETQARAPRDIIQHLFEHDKALEVAQSIASRGYFPNEPLLAVKESGRLVVVEGNRRLAALKALLEPGVVEGAKGRQLARLARKLADSSTIEKVPVVIAPSRRRTDRLVAGRHVGTPVLAWQAENRASFILDKLEEGYDAEQLLDQLGFSLSDVQKARQTRAVADMARALDLPDEVKAKVADRNAKIFTTLERVFDSTVGRGFLKVEPSATHGLVIKTSKSEFVRAFGRLVTDAALGHVSSRTLNTSENIKEYFGSWPKADLPTTKPKALLPSDVVGGKKSAHAKSEGQEQRRLKSKAKLSAVLPRDLKVRYGSERLIDIRSELIKLKRESFPNAGAVLLRVFFELAVMEYLNRSGDLERIVGQLKSKGKLQGETPSMRQLVPELIKIAKRNFKAREAERIEKALKYDPAAPFNISDLHSFVHQSGDLPGERDILQFWLRTEPLFRLMLERDVETAP